MRFLAGWALIALVLGFALIISGPEHFISISTLVKYFLLGSAVYVPQIVLLYFVQRPREPLWNLIVQVAAWPFVALAVVWTPFEFGWPSSGQAEVYDFSSGGKTQAQEPPSKRITIVL